METVKTRIMLETEKELTAGLTEAERYRYFLGRMQYLRYTSGKENLLKSDCSGSVCLALLLATGCAIRVTADTLYRKFFTKNDDGKSDSIRAAFFISNYDRPPDENGRVYHENEVAHVCGICGDDVVLDCSPPRSRLRSLSSMIRIYQTMDYRCRIKCLDRNALEEASARVTDLFGADPEYEEYIRAITEDKN